MFSGIYGNSACYLVILIMLRFSDKSIM